MQEMKLIDAVALKEKWLCSDHKGMFVDFIDNAPEIPAVPLDVHERMKRELNEEIEKVKEKSIYFAKECQKARAETDRVTAIAAEWKEAAYTYADNIDRIKSEAIKEFGEFLKNKATAIHKSIDGNYLYELSNNFIDNLVKEMAGEG